MSSAIPYLPTALGASKATLLLGNNPSSGPFAWYLPQCNVTSNPYGGTTGTYGLASCIALQYGAVSVVTWFYLPPGGYGVIIGNNGGASYPNSPNGWVPIIYVGTNGLLYIAEWSSSSGCGWITAPISPGWHMVVWAEGNISSSSATIYGYLDGKFIGSFTENGLTYTVGGYSPPPAYWYFGNGYTGGCWCGGNVLNCSYNFFNGAIALVALYNRVLTTGDVLAIYQGNLVTSGLVAVWYGDDYNSGNGYWISRVGGYTGAPVTSSYPPRGCILWNSALYSGPTGIWSNWQQC